MKETKFKQTEFGIIPGDWEECTLRELIDVLTDFTANGSFESLAQNVKYLEKPSYARLIRLTDIRTNFANDGIYVSKESYNFLKKSYLEGGELLLANVGAYAGYSFIYPKNLSFRGTLGPNMFLIKFFNQKIDSMFAYYAFSHGIVFNQLVSKAASSAQPKLNKEDVRTCFVHIPSSLTEQKNIAQTLSDVDAVISTTEKLIAKKKALNQGAMQTLLSGKMRIQNGKWIKTTHFKQTELGPIPQEWEVKRIGNFCKVYDGTHQTPKYVDFGIPFFSVENVSANDFNHTKFISLDEYMTISKRAAIKKGDILMTRIGSIGVCKYVDWDKKAGFYVSLALLKCNDGINPQFLVHYTCTNAFKKEIELHSLTTAIPQKINLGPIAHVRIAVPSNIEEQTAIATALSDMDSEITALETKLAKYRQLKTGMMQQLLTGKVRLV